MNIPDIQPGKADASKSAAPRHRLFISHAGVDSQQALKLAERIEAAGLPVWIDKKHLRPGEPWLDQLENALTRETTAFAIYLTASGAEKWVRMEVREALVRKVDAESQGRHYPFIPLIANQSTSLQKLPPFARHYHGVFLDDEAALQKLIATVTGDGTGNIVLVENPFMGLEAFTSADSHLFFGREQETRDLIDRLQQTTLLLVAGDSGSGKSSLVKASLIPAFREGCFAPKLGQRPDPQMFHVVEMRPLGDPFEGLITAISNAARGLHINAQLLDRTFQRLRRQDPSAMRDALREGAPPGSRILLVIDQFEELWTLTADSQHRSFLEGLLNVAREGEFSRLVVATVRRDYLAQAGTHPTFAKRLEQCDSSERHGIYNLRRMTDPGLRACIERPLALAGVQREQARELADEILRDAGDQPGDLALIQMALSETWEKRSGHRRLIDAYRAIGRIEGAIRNAADEVYGALSTEQQRRAETIFMRLVRLGDARGTTRRVAGLDELDEPTQELARYLGSKEGKRLVVLGAAKGGTVELAHEQLTSQWPTYAGWLRDEGGDQRATDKRTLDLLSTLQAAGVTWLPRSVDRRMFQSLLKRRPFWLSKSERLLVERSRMLAYAQWGLLTVAVMAVAGAAGLVYLDQTQRTAALETQLVASEAKSIGFQLEFPNGEISERDRAALEQLSAPAQATERSRAVKQAFVDDLFRHDALAKRVTRRPETVVRALTGTDLKSRQYVTEWLQRERALTPTGVITRGLFLAELSVGPIEPLLDAMAISEDPDEFDTLAQGLATFSRQLTGAQGERAILPLLTAVAATDESWKLEALSQALAALPVGFTDQQREQGIAALLTAMGETHDPQQLAELSQALAALPFELTDAQGEQAVAVLLAAMAATRYSGERLRQLSEGLATLTRRLSEAQAARSFKQILESISATDNPLQLRALRQGLTAFAGRLGGAHAKRFIAPMLAAMTTADSPGQLVALGQGLSDLSVELADMQRDQAVALLLAAMTATFDSSLLVTLSQLLAALPAKLTNVQGEQAVAPLLLAMAATHDPSQLVALSQGLAALPVKLTNEQREQAVAPLLLAMAATQDTSQLAALSGGLATLPLVLTDAQVEQAIALLLGAIAATNDHSQLRTLGRGLAALTAQLSEEQSARQFERLMAAMQTKNYWQGRPLGQGLATLSGRLGEAQSGRQFERVLAAIATTRSFGQLRPLGQSLGELAGRLSAAQRERLVPALLEVMAATSDPNQLEALVQGLARLSGDLTDAQVRPAVASLLAAMASTRDPWQLVVLSQGLSELPVALTDAEQALVVTRLFWALALGPWQDHAPGMILSTIALYHERNELRALGRRSLVVLTGRLSATRAAQQFEQLLAVMAATNEPWQIKSLGQGLAVLASRLSGAHGEAAVAQLLMAMATTDHVWHRVALSQTLAALPIDLADLQGERAVDSLMVAMQTTHHPEELKALVGALVALTERLSEKSALQAKVDAMKIPSMAGAPTRLLVTAINERFSESPRTVIGSGHWEVIEWIAVNYPAVELVAPPSYVFRQVNTALTPVTGTR